MSARPKRLVVVFGTGTDVGKTFVGCGIVAAARSRGLSVAARKPVQSFAVRAGSSDGTVVVPTDADLLAAATGEAATVVCAAHRWYPLAVAPPMAAARLGRPPITLDDLVAESSWPEAVDVGLVETAGGPRSPIAVDGDGIALAQRLRADASVLVADAGLGTINAVRLAAAAIEPRPVVVLNRFDADDELHVANLRWLTDVDGLRVVVDATAALDALFGN